MLREALGQWHDFQTEAHLTSSSIVQNAGPKAFAYSEAEGRGPISRRCLENCKGTRLRLRLTHAVWI
jgi:hypothetical protein